MYRRMTSGYNLRARAHVGSNSKSPLAHKHMRAGTHTYAHTQTTYLKLNGCMVVFISMSNVIACAPHLR